MVLLRRVIGDALRARRQAQHRTLREVSTVANVSLGYLSEIERGQKEPSSELLSAVCEALGAQLSDLLREVSDTLALDEQMNDMLLPVDQPGAAERADAGGVDPRVIDGKVSVAVRRDGPLRTTLRATRTLTPGPIVGGPGADGPASGADAGRAVVYAA
ncbi:MAG TPA: helix-turn-helix transcriptional regulator [Micromonosporaceae bacterium]|nr:helix-turn-helix transcriptional regulator [Micromonosporaceae bacterium]